MALYKPSLTSFRGGYFNAAPLFHEIAPVASQDLHYGKSIVIHSAQAEMVGTLGWTTPLMLTAIHQILNCPYAGEIKKLYLESKALELIALKLEQIRQTGKELSKTSLNPDDLCCLYRAREILLQNIEHPPLLTSLARQVGINDFKLKRGFRQVFGTTVFGYLHQHRMEQARQLLETQDVRIAQVAQTVGYANPSQFSAAFKRKYGYSPKGYRALYKAETASRETSSRAGRLRLGVKKNPSQS